MSLLSSGRSTWIPFLAITILTLIYLNLFATVSSQFSLREVCLDMGLAPDCSDKAAIKKVSALGVPMLLIPGIVTLFSIGIVSAFADRMGRKHTLSLAITGQAFSTLGWFLVFYFPSLFRSHWKVIVIAAMTFQALTGGILSLYLAIFGFLSDISSKQPSLRTGLYVAVDVIISITGIIGSQLGGFLMNKDGRIMLGLIVGGLGLNVVLIYLFMSETIDESIKNAPIDLKKANILSQLGFLFPLKSTKELLETDHQKIVKKITELYEIQNSISLNNPTAIPHPFSDPLDNVNFNGKLNDQQQRYYSGESSSDLGASMSWDGPYSDQGSFAAEESYLKDDKKSNLLETNCGRSDIVGSSSFVQEVDGSAPLSTVELSAPPRLIPHRNAIPMLVASLFLFSLNGIGYGVVSFFYLKAKFKITPSDYSNASVVRFVCSFLVFPFLKKIFKAPTAEKRFLVGLLVVQAIVYGMMPQATSFFQFCIGVVINCFAGIFPTGIIRSLSSNQVSQSLQSHVLSATVASEVLVFVFGALSFNMAWLGTQDRAPTTVFYIAAALSLVCACLPLLISDSTEDFNLRVEMTMQYTKIMSEEKERAEKKVDSELSELSELTEVPEIYH